MQREPYSKVFDYTCSHSGIYDGMQAGQWCLSCNCIHSVVCARRLESIASCGSICILFFSWVCGYVTSCVYFSVDNFRFCRWTTAALVLLVIHICARCLRTDGTHRCLLHAPLPAATSYRQLSIHLQVLERSVQLALLLPFCPVKCMFMYSVFNSSVEAAEQAGLVARELWKHCIYLLIFITQEACLIRFDSIVMVSCTIV